VILRILNLAAIGALVGSALYAYSIKYDTLMRAERLTKLKASIQRERDGVAVLRAEWQYLNKPERLQALSAKHLDLAPLQIFQLGTLADLPIRGDKGDEIGRKLEALGLAAPTATPKDSGLRTDARTQTSSGGQTPTTATASARPRQ